MISGTVFNIQKFSVHDGPGIRTTVFLKGCPLRCLWCHNPEGLSREPDLEYEPAKCIACRACSSVCDHACHSFEAEEDGTRHIFDRTNCIKCGKCTDICISSSLKTIGKTMTVSEVMQKVLADRIFYEKSGGGMTLSGGEPFMQPKFALELLRTAKESGLNTAVETCGSFSSDIIAEALPLVDLFLFDYKATGSELHKKLTGVMPELILSNLNAISSSGGKIVLRCPIIPGANDTDEHFSDIASIAETHAGILSVDLEPYHPLGTGKAPKIGSEQSFITEAPSSERMNDIRDFIAERTSKPVQIS